MSNFKDMPLDATLQKGDVVTITGPGEHDVLVREVTRLDARDDSVVVAGMVVVLERDEHTLTRIQRPVPALPTVEGDYILTSSGVRRIRSLIGGNWVGVAGFRVSETALRDYVEAGATLTRMIPADEVKHPKVDVKKARTEFVEKHTDSCEIDFEAVLRRVLAGEFDL